MSIICLSFLLSFLNCGSDFSDEIETFTEEIFQIDPVLEHQFGAENLPDEYLLVKPRGLDVDDEERVYVMDEHRIKVYNPDGSPHNIFGNRGQGPGEFLNDKGYFVTIGPTGYIAAQRSSRLKDEFNVYRPDYSFVNVFHEGKNNARTSGLPLKLIALSDTSYISVEAVTKREEDHEIATETLAYYHGTEKTIIASYDRIIYVFAGKWSQSFIGSGDIVWDVVSDETVIYTQTRLDAVHTDKGYFFSLHIFNLKTGERTAIQHQFDPVPLQIISFAEYLDMQPPDARESFNNKQKRVLHNKTNELLRQYQFETPIHYMYSDVGILYVKRSSSYQDEWKRLDIFDIENRRYLRSIAVLRNFDGHFKNRKIYRQDTDEEGFSVIKVLALPPEVYAR